MAKTQRPAENNEERMFDLKALDEEEEATEKTDEEVEIGADDEEGLDIEETSDLWEE